MSWRTGGDMVLVLQSTLWACNRGTWLHGDLHWFPQRHWRFSAPESELSNSGASPWSLGRRTKIKKWHKRKNLCCAMLLIPSSAPRFPCTSDSCPVFGPSLVPHVLKSTPVQTLFLRHLHLFSSYLLFSLLTHFQLSIWSVLPAL